MSRQLTNDLTWSVSRARLFRSCQRAYYYQYYGAWGGWDANAPERARHLYALKQMTSFPLWAGSIVHEVVRDALMHCRSTHFMPTTGELQENARRRLNQGWLQSRKQLWKSDPKRNTNLFEHYYAEEGSQVPQEEINALKTKVFDALEGFRNCELADLLPGLEEWRWGDVDLLTSFVAGELPASGNAPKLPIKVWCALDFSYLGHDEKLHIIDWKTGGEHREELRIQLACYALYAMKTKGTPLEKISLEGVFLNDGGRTSTYEISTDTIMAAQEQMLFSAGAMRAKLRDPLQNIADEEDFPCNGCGENCGRCPFQEVCPAALGGNQEFF